MDFTQMPVSLKYKYLLVMIDTFRGWIEGFPSQTEKAEEVLKKKKTKNKKLLHQIILRFGLPRSLQSNNGTSFTSKFTQGVSKALLLLLLPSHFSRVRLCATPYTTAHQAPPSLGFSRQEYWSGLPFPSPMHESEK